MKKGSKKMIKIILFILLALFACTMLFMAWVISSNNKQYASSPVLIEGNTASSKKAMIVYQPSRTSTAKDVAFYIGDELRADYQSILIDYPGEHLPIDLSQYDLVIFGSPIYAAQPSKVLTNYIQTLEETNDITTILYTIGDNQSEEDLDNVRQTLTSQSIDCYFKIIRSEFKANPAQSISPIFTQLANEQ